MTAVDARSLLQTLREHEPDWAVRWLIDHADPELWAPRQFVIVDELTKGSPTLATIWRTIYRLWLFYRPINRATTTSTATAGSMTLTRPSSKR